MNQPIRSISVVLLTAAFLSFHSNPSFAKENIKELKKQIEQLQKRVEELESSSQPQVVVPVPPIARPRYYRQWDPFAEMELMQRQMDRMFQDSFYHSPGFGRGMFSSQMSFENDFDIKETKEGYDITFDITGFDENKVDVQIDESSITVMAQQMKKDKQKNKNSSFESRSFGSFLRTVPVPADADSSKAQTKKDGNKLIIHLPKKAT